MSETPEDDNDKPGRLSEIMDVALGSLVNSIAEAEQEIERLTEALHWRFSRSFGASSDALFREAMGLPVLDRWAYPHDRWDSDGTEATYEQAPGWMKPLMLPRLEWYREIARLGYPLQPPDRDLPPAGDIP